MKHTFPLALIALTALSGCSKKEPSVDAETIIVTDESGKKMRYYVDRIDDKKISSGFNGNESFQELRSIKFRDKEDAYVITSEELKIYIPKTLKVEVYTKKN
jgi:hypothetical protein